MIRSLKDTHLTTVVKVNQVNFNYEIFGAYNFMTNNWMELYNYVLVIPVL